MLQIERATTEPGKTPKDRDVTKSELNSLSRSEILVYFEDCQCPRPHSRPSKGFGGGTGFLQVQEMQESAADTQSAYRLQLSTMI